MITPLDKGSLVHEALEQLPPRRCSTGPPAERPAAGRAVVRRPTGGCSRRSATRSATSTRRKGLVGPAHLLGPRPPPDPRRPRRHPRRSTPPTASPTAPRPLAAELGVRVRASTRSTRWRSRCPTGAPCASAAGSTASTSPTTAPSTSSTTRPARYRDGYSDLLARTTPIGGGTQAAARRSTAWPAGSPRQDPTPPVHAEYWFVTTQGRVQARAATTSPTRCSSAGRPTCSATIVAGIEAGVFAAAPHRRCPPTSGSSATSCDPDGLGTAELRKQWERKRHDPALRPLRRAGRARCEEVEDGDAPMLTPPPDQAARDRIADDLDTTLFVEAGAGSGKTTALVDRVVALVTLGRRRAARHRRHHLHREGRRRAARPRPPRAAGALGRRRPPTPRTRPAAAARSTSSTAPPSARCTPSPSGSCPSTRSRRSCRPRSRCSTR